MDANEARRVIVEMAGNYALALICLAGACTTIGVMVGMVVTVIAGHVYECGI